jgi:hypothetical protein
MWTISVNHKVLVGRVELREKTCITKRGRGRSEIVGTRSVVRSSVISLAREGMRESIDLVRGKITAVDYYDE